MEGRGTPDKSAPWRLCTEHGVRAPREGQKGWPGLRQQRVHVQNLCPLSRRGTGTWGPAAAPGSRTKGSHGVLSTRLRAVTTSSAATGRHQQPSSQAVPCQLAHPLHPGVGPQGVLEHKVPEHLHPRVVLRQVVVVLGRDLPHLRGGGGQRPGLGTDMSMYTQTRVYTNT